LIKSLNETLLERKVDAQYATLLVAFWQPQNRTLRMANAGSCAPLVWRQGEILKPRIEGVPIGLLEDIDYEELEVTLESGDVVLLYSDGVEDQVNAQGEEFGRSRVLKLLKKHHADTPKEIANTVISELDSYRGGTAISDDQSVIVLRVP